MEVRIRQEPSGRFTADLVLITGEKERVHLVPGDFETVTEAELAGYRLAEDLLMPRDLH